MSVLMDIVEDSMDKDKTIKKLQQQIEDMKCCANCGYYSNKDFRCFQKFDTEKVCPKWQSDGLTAKEREI